MNFVVGGGGQRAACARAVPEWAGQAFQRSHELQREPSEAGFLHVAGICLSIYLKPRGEDIV